MAQRGACRRSVGVGPDVRRAGHGACLRGRGARPHLAGKVLSKLRVTSGLSPLRAKMS